MNNNIIVKRTKDDDFLDNLSLKINKILKTDKDIKDKKNNVYFWLIKFILLVLYILVLNGILEFISIVGYQLIYYFAVSLRGIIATVWVSVLSITKEIVILYIVFKNLNIFTSSSYYERLYHKDKKMNSKKNKFFTIVNSVLKLLSVPYLIVIGFYASLLLVIFAFLIFLLFNGIYSFSLIFLVIASFVLCYISFKDIENKFFNDCSPVKKYTYLKIFAVILLGVFLFGYETGNYNYSNAFPTSFNVEEKELFFDVENRKNIVVKSDSKYDNLSIHIDNNLENKIKIVFEYFNTAKVDYKSYLVSNSNLLLEFESNLHFSIANVYDVIKFSVDTIKDQTLYNYNLFKYPNIKIYVSEENYKKIKVLGYKDDILDFEEV